MNGSEARVRACVCMYVRDRCAAVRFTATTQQKQNKLHAFALTWLIGWTV